MKTKFRLISFPFKRSLARSTELINKPSSRVYTCACGLSVILCYQQIITCLLGRTPTELKQEIYLFLTSYTVSISLDYINIQLLVATQHQQQFHLFINWKNMIMMNMLEVNYWTVYDQLKVVYATIGTWLIAFPQISLNS